ncbi:hypothetical protein P154DRAFT_573116 [Amniculicola lignicola CBS 123094]|uniref:Uncharacterized protein n=1 Tax=Amniculicola lignicola CBS 123094 TaxID=1392246 RepID=A0A6A5WPQ3_9PLEO|nr:hypothetical protein P154DRAFT_573116 [Amniculicola lignicola CBS 123094]
MYGTSTLAFEEQAPQRTFGPLGKQYYRKQASAEQSASFQISYLQISIIALVLIGASFEILHWAGGWRLGYQGLPPRMRRRRSSVGEERDGVEFRGLHVE